MTIVCVASRHFEIEHRQPPVVESQHEIVKLPLDARAIPSVNVSNVLNEEKKQQVIALGRLGWSMRRIQRAIGVRRETAATYLKADGIPFRPPFSREEDLDLPE